MQIRCKYGMQPCKHDVSPVHACLHCRDTLHAPLVLELGLELELVYVFVFVFKELELELVLCVSVMGLFLI